MPTPGAQEGMDSIINFLVGREWAAMARGPQINCQVPVVHLFPACSNPSSHSMMDDSFILSPLC